MKFFENDKCNFFVGGNAKENWTLISNSNLDDIWVHLKDFSSSHVIVSVKNFCYDNYDISVSDIMYACTLCKQFSKYKNYDKKLDVVYTEVRNLKKGKVIGNVDIMKAPSVIKI